VARYRAISLRGAINIGANFAKFIGYCPRLRKSVPAAERSELGYHDANYTRMLAANWL